MSGYPSGDSDYSSELSSSCSTVSPIQSIPNELLAHIFTIGANIERSSDYTFKLPFPLLVSSITQRWRNVAISSPPVWSNLIFTNDVRTDRWCATIWLPRSGIHPLDITIDLIGRRTKDHIMDLISPHITRWRRLSVKAWDRIDMQIFLSPLQVRTVSAPLLQHVEFRCLEDEDPYGWLHKHRFLADTPSLKSIRLRGLCIRCAPPLVGLTALHLDSHRILLSHSEICDIVTASPTLTTLMLRLLRVAFPVSEDLSVIKIPSLRFLAMNFRHCEDTFVRLFSLLSTPALESLELVHMNRGQISNFVWSLHLPPQLRRRYQNVQILKLFYFGGFGDMDYLFVNDILRQFFELFPNVVSLYQVGNKEEFVTCPHLESLKFITFYSTREEQIKWLFDEVKERNSNGHPLTRVLVSQYNINLDEDVWSRLRAIVEVVGLDDEILRYTGESDDEMVDDYEEEDQESINENFSDYSAEEWENDYEEEIDGDDWDSD